MQLLFKILGEAEWAAARQTGAYAGSEVDHKDGYIHLSAAHQVRETAAKHFAGRSDLVLLAIPDEQLDGLKWETSRGGDLFPHVYGVIPVSVVAWFKPLPLVAGAFRFPDEAEL
jgi:uncharacterized protein (DUF952 family)